MLDSKVDTLLSVAETLSFTRSAEALSLTQPAVSHHVKALEKELNVTLFARKGKEIQLTEEGETVVKYARRMRSLVTTMKQALEDERHSVHRLTIGVTPTAEHNIISQVLAMYCREQPGLHITIISDSIKNIYDKLRVYELHLAVVEGSIIDKNYNSILLDTDYLVVAVANGNPLSKKSMVTLDELKQQKLILRLPDSGTRALFESNLRSSGESIDNFNVILEVDNNSTIKELVQADFGVSIISKSACLQDVRKNKFKILPLENLSMIRKIHIVYRKDFEHVSVLDDITRIYNEMLDAAHACESSYGVFPRG